MQACVSLRLQDTPQPSLSRIAAAPAPTSRTFIDDNTAVGTVKQAALCSLNRQVGQQVVVWRGNEPKSVKVGQRTRRLLAGQSSIYTSSSERAVSGFSASGRPACCRSGVWGPVVAFSFACTCRFALLRRRALCIAYVAPRAFEPDYTPGWATWPKCVRPHGGTRIAGGPGPWALGLGPRQLCCAHQGTRPTTTLLPPSINCQGLGQANLPWCPAAGTWGTRQPLRRGQPWRARP